MCESQHLGGGHPNGAKCPPDTIVESAKWCAWWFRGVPSGGAGKGGVSPPLLVEEGLLNGTLLRIRGNFSGV